MILTRHGQEYLLHSAKRTHYLSTQGWGYKCLVWFNHRYLNTQKSCIQIYPVAWENQPWGIHSFKQFKSGLKTASLKSNKKTCMRIKVLLLLSINSCSLASQNLMILFQTCLPSHVPGPSDSGHQTPHPQKSLLSFTVNPALLGSSFVWQIQLYLLHISLFKVIKRNPFSQGKYEVMKFLFVLLD